MEAKVKMNHIGEIRRGVKKMVVSLLVIYM